MSMINYILFLLSVSMFFLNNAELLQAFDEQHGNPTLQIHVNSKTFAARDALAYSSENDPMLLKMFDQLVEEWGAYHKKNPAFNIGLLLDAANFAIPHYAEQYNREGQSSLPHVVRLTYVLWNTGKVRSINILTASLLDHIDETGVTDDEIKNLFGSKIYLKSEDHGPTYSEEEHRQAHLEIAPKQSINAQMIQLAHQIESIHYRKNFDAMSKEDIANYLGWSKKMLAALHGANEHLENALYEEILQRE